MNVPAVIDNHTNVEAYRASTNAADLCKEIVVATSSNIQGRKFVSVEGWQAIAVAHGCVLSARDVEKVEGGVRAIGEVRRMSDGQIIATGEGFVGEDEPTWYGGDNGRGRTLPKRNDYAIRAMAQTRAMSRAGRTAFAHVVVMMKAGLATTPAEEVPHDGFDNHTGEVIEAKASRPAGNGKDAPFPPGPAKNKTDLKAKGREVWKDIEACGDVDELDACLLTHREVIDQISAALPAWWNGGSTQSGEKFEGLGEVIARKKTELAAEAHWQPTPLNAG